MTRVFISQSGDRGLELALKLEGFLRKVVPDSEPWVSKTGIEKGAAFPKEIHTNLIEALAGIICLTSENQTEPWILFEAGALALKPSERVWTLLLDLDAGDVKRPLGDFQHTLAKDQGEVFAMVKSISRVVNEALDKTVREEDLKELFDTFWSKDLGPAVEALRAQAKAGAPKERDPKDMLREILEGVREIRRVDSWRIQKTLALLANFYRSVLNRKAPSMAELRQEAEMLESMERLLTLNAESGAIAIEAPPGTGKTRTTLALMAELLARQEKKDDPKA